MTLSITPEKKHCNAEIAIMPEAISVGKRGTNPVCKYSYRTGINKINANKNNSKDNIPKKGNGRYSLNNVKMVRITL